MKTFLIQLLDTHKHILNQLIPKSDLAPGYKLNTKECEPQWQN